ncbi:hypothetical protein MKX01_039881 [Papaver californicum]|nr:hypothetical protein MKX01_039881 [Papaver californicum]
MITGVILAKIVEYLNKHADTQTSDAELKIWDEQFVNYLNRNPTVFDMIKAADYLRIKGLVDLLAQGVADGMKAITPEALRGTFTISNQFYPEKKKKKNKMKRKFCSSSAE